jgi:hypothetical protein
MSFGSLSRILHRVAHRGVGIGIIAEWYRFLNHATAAACQQLDDDEDYHHDRDQ